MTSGVKRAHRLLGGEVHKKVWEWTGSEKKFRGTQQRVGVLSCPVGKGNLSDSLVSGEKTIGHRGRKESRRGGGTNY